MRSKAIAEAAWNRPKALSRSQFEVAVARGPLCDVSQENQREKEP
jgi:hypothetical protein